LIKISEAEEDKTVITI